MHSGLRGLDDVMPTITAPESIAGGIRVGVLVDTHDATVGDLVSAAVVEHELRWRLAPAVVETYTSGPNAAELGWVWPTPASVPRDVAAGVNDEALDLLVVLHDGAEVRLSNTPETDPNVVLPWNAGDGDLDSWQLLELAPRVLDRGSVSSLNPRRARRGYLAVSIDAEGSFDAVHAGEIARLAVSERLEVVLVRDPLLSSARGLEPARSAFASHDVDVEPLGDGLTPAGYVGVLADATLVVTTSAAVAALSRPFNPRVALLDEDGAVDHVVQRVLRAALATQRRPDAALEAERRLDSLCEHLDQLATSRAGRALDGERSLQLLRQRLQEARRVEAALLTRLARERERAMIANESLRDSISSANEERDAAREAELAALQAMTTQQAHLNALELRVAELDQGVVTPTLLPVRYRLFAMFERAMGALARRIRPRLARQ